MLGAPIGVDASSPLQMTRFINNDLYDRSALVQMTANYYGLDLQDCWSHDHLGSKHSDFRSWPLSVKRSL